jgi:DNA-binding MarR family transcriptional regulator
MEVMGARADSKLAIATDVWKVMATFAFARVQSGRHLVLLRQLGLTPGHLKALATLDPETPRPMRALSDALHCDPSMATWFVDRLEEKGLVERGAMSSDRRVKTVVLTPFGVRTREQLLASLFEPPPELLELDASRLKALRAALAPLPTPASPFTPASEEPDPVPAR